MTNAAAERRARFGESLPMERKHILLGLGITALTLLTLKAYGRPRWCACGSLLPWSADINASHAFP